MARAPPGIVPDRSEPRAPLCSRGIKGDDEPPMTQAPATHHAPSPERSVPTRITREEIVRLGQSNAPWQFIPLALKGLQIQPADMLLRFLLAANYAKLGLAEVASEELGLLAAAGVSDPAIDSLRRVVSEMPAALVPYESRIEILKANINVLQARALDLGPSIETLLDLARDRAGTVEVHQTLCGNLLTRACSAQSRCDGSGGWYRFANDYIEASSSTPIEPAPSESPGSGWPKPVTVVGLAPPWTFRRVVASMARLEGGYWPRVNLVHTDLGSFVDALSLIDLREELSQDRVHIFIGPGANDRFAADLASRDGTQIAGPVLRVAGTSRARTEGAAAEPGVDAEPEALIEHATRAQKRTEADLAARVESLYASRTRAWWRDRFAIATASGSPPLRVLIPTCRYTTFLKHSAEDCADALRRAGHQAHVLIEPDDSSLLATVGYLRAIAEFEPDLILAVNRTRASFPGIIPANVPMVCWIQDAMSHLFDRDMGQTLGPLDFLVGHTHEDLFTRFGYPRERSMTLPVLASEHKFHPTPVRRSLHERLTCDVAYVSHHSETPEQLHARIIKLAIEPPVAATFQRLFPRVREAIQNAGTQPLQSNLRLLTTETARQTLGAEPDPRALSLMESQYVMPMADRMIRHETLRWAKEIAQRRGWQLRIHGRGWNQNAEFSSHASDPLNHGEELRASYQAARAHLHVSVHWMYHQRVMECALSGGMPLCRAKQDDLSMLHGFVMMKLNEEAQAFACRISPFHAHLYAVADHPEAMRLTALWQRLGVQAVRPTIAVAQEWLRTSEIAWSGMPRAADVAWMLGDPAETMFRDRAELESALERAIERPSWRDQASKGIASRVSQTFTYSSALGRVIEMVSHSLNAD